MSNDLPTLLIHRIRGQLNIYHEDVRHFSMEGSFFHVMTGDTITTGEFIYPAWTIDRVEVKW